MYKKALTQYQIDKDHLRLKAYQLLCLFYANEKISKVCLPDENRHPLRELESSFLFPQASSLLLEIAILFRVMDNQLKNSNNESIRTTYFSRLNETDTKYECMLFDDNRTGLRETCNKIIHATSFEPHSAEGHGPHEHDYESYFDGVDKKIVWDHLNCNVRLVGKRDGKEWYMLLQIPIFVEALSFLLNDSLDGMK